MKRAILTLALLGLASAVPGSTSSNAMPISISGTAIQPQHGIIELVQHRGGARAGHGASRGRSVNRSRSATSRNVSKGRNVAARLKIAM